MKVRQSRLLLRYRGDSRRHSGPMRSIAWALDGNIAWRWEEPFPEVWSFGTASNRKWPRISGRRSWEPHAYCLEPGWKTGWLPRAFDGDIGLWNTESGELIHEFGAHNGAISGAAGVRMESVWFPAARTTLSESGDAETGQQLNRLPGHRANVSSVDWSSKEDWIVSGLDDGTVRFWRPHQNQDAMSIPGRNCVAWSPDGSRIVSNDPRHEGDETCSILDSRTGEIVKPLQSIGGGSMNVLHGVRMEDDCRQLQCTTRHTSGTRQPGGCCTHLPSMTVPKYVALPGRQTTVSLPPAAWTA